MKKENDMKIAILGSGTVGQTLAGKLIATGAAVSLGTRDPEATKARVAAGASDGPSFSAWHAMHPTVRVATFADAAATADLVILAAAGRTALETLEQTGAENLTGKVLIDVTNPLDFSQGFPPFLSVCNTDSLGERIQAAFPNVHVVKALNTVAAPVMIAPDSVHDGNHTLFVCGNDDEAKAKVTRHLKSWFGWRDVLDLGNITNARGTEGYLLLWTRIYGTTKSPLYNVDVRR
ncbi:MAG: NAD(P)-binding domain-containing protein [Myxococcota bacterium]